MVSRATYEGWNGLRQHRKRKRLRNRRSRRRASSCRRSLLLRRRRMLKACRDTCSTVGQIVSNENSLWRCTRHRKAQRKATAMAASHHGSRQRDRERPGRLHLRCAREAARDDPSGVARVERGRWRVDTSRHNPRQCLPDDTFRIHSFIHSFVHSHGLPFQRTCQASSPSLCWHRSRWLGGMTRRGLHT